MPVCWTARKTNGRFPSLPTALGNRKRRDFHIPTAPARRGKVENQKQVFHFPTCCFSVSKPNPERRPGGGSLRSRSRLQAHSSIRKCSLETPSSPEGAEVAPRPFSWRRCCGSAARCLGGSRRAAGIAIFASARNSLKTFRAVSLPPGCVFEVSFSRRGRSASV